MKNKLIVSVDESIKLIYLQFSFTNKKAVSGSLQLLEEEAEYQSKERKSEDCTGVQLIEPTAKVGCENLLEELLAVGFVIDDAIYQKRYNYASGGGSYHMVRFVFKRKAAVSQAGTEYYQLWETSVLEALQEIITSSMWRARAYNNPLKSGCMLSFNFEARVPLFKPDGKPEVRWEKDAYGNKVGEKPRTLRPEVFLRVV